MKTKKKSEFAKLPSGDKVILVIGYTILGLFLLAIILPMVYIILASFIDPITLQNSGLTFDFSKWTLTAYKRVLSNNQIWIGFWNALLYSVLFTIISVVVTLLAAYPARPRFWIAVFDTGGTVDTLAQHARRLPLPEHPWQDIFPLLHGDAATVARAATQSARWHDAVLPKPDFAAFLAAARQSGALGLCTAHSGTVLGALFPPELTKEAVEVEASKLCAAVPALAFLRLTRLRAGGIEVSMSEKRYLQR